MGVLSLPLIFHEKPKQTVGAHYRMAPLILQRLPYWTGMPLRLLELIRYKDSTCLLGCMTRSWFGEAKFVTPFGKYWPVAGSYRAVEE